MKSFTDLEQSKKLAKILPIKSADMFWYKDSVIKEANPRVMSYMQIPERQSMYYSPCWSLTALLDVLPVSCDDGQHCLALINPNPNDKTEWLCAYEDCKGDLIMECYADNSVDVCYEMILKLHELKML